MNSRISTGPTVQSTSTVVLWVKRAGVGLALALKRMMHQSSRPSTRNEMPNSTGSRIQLWNHIASMAQLGDARLEVDRAVRGLTDQVRRRRVRRDRRRHQSRPGPRGAPRDAESTRLHVPHGLDRRSAASLKTGPDKPFDRQGGADRPLQRASRSITPPPVLRGVHTRNMAPCQGARPRSAAGAVLSVSRTPSSTLSLAPRRPSDEPYFHERPRPRPVPAAILRRRPDAGRRNARRGHRRGRRWRAVPRALGIGSRSSSTTGG